MYLIIIVSSCTLAAVVYSSQSFYCKNLLFAAEVPDSGVVIKKTLFSDTTGCILPKNQLVLNDKKQIFFVF